jgi:hypothetical protein
MAELGILNAAIGPADLLMLRGTVTTVAAIPEPETHLLMSAGLVTLWLARRRSRRGARID